MRNLTRALFEHGRIITTVAKAKEARPFVEKLITLGKRGTLHARRMAISQLRDKEAVGVLFKEIAPRFADRPGGYTRIIKRHERRLGDAGETAYLELLKEGEIKEPRQRAAAPAPAPRVTGPAPEEKKPEMELEQPTPTSETEAQTPPSEGTEEKPTESSEGQTDEVKEEPASEKSEEAKTEESPEKKEGE